jgi:hypothetical protein
MFQKVVDSLKNIDIYGNINIALEIDYNRISKVSIAILPIR